MFKSVQIVLSMMEIVELLMSSMSGDDNYVHLEMLYLYLGNNRRCYEQI